MNQTELLGFKWLKKQGYKDKDIKFNCNKSPDFVCADGKRYEIKSLSQLNQAVFYSVQVKSLKPNDVILIFKKGKYLTKFLWKERKKGFPFSILSQEELVTIQIPREILHKLQGLKSFPQETHAQILKRILKENEHLNTLICSNT